MMPCMKSEERYEKCNKQACSGLKMGIKNKEFLMIFMYIFLCHTVLLLRGMENEKSMPLL